MQDFLLDVVVSATSPADSETDMVARQVLPGKVAERLGERGREQEVPNIAIVLVCNLTISLVLG